MSEISKITRWSERIDADAPAARIIDRFGGLTRFCQATNFPTSTVHDWLIKGLIPQARWPAIKEMGRAVDIELTNLDFVDQRNG